MKRRSGTSEDEGRGGRGGLSMLWKTFLTCEGSGRVVIVTSYRDRVSRVIREVGSERIKKISRTAIRGLAIKE